MKFHELGWPHVYDADRLFEAMPRTADGIHFAANSETTANINSIVSAVIRHASTLLPWDWMKLQCQWHHMVIPPVEVTNLEKLADEGMEEGDGGEATPKASGGKGAMPEKDVEKEPTQKASPKVKRHQDIEVLDEPPSPCSPRSEVDYDREQEESSERESARDAPSERDDGDCGSRPPTFGGRQPIQRCRHGAGRRCDAGSGSCHRGDDSQARAGKAAAATPAGR